MTRFLSTAIFIALLHACRGQGYVSNLFHPQDSALIKLGKYDSTVRPPGLHAPDDPVNVTINFFIRRIERIDHLNNELEIQITFREEWIDSRLSYENYPHDIAINDVSLFWKPDVFFSNEKRGHLHTITKPNVFARLKSNGKVMLSSRFSLTLNCPMELWDFPFDVQTCELRLPSYGYTTDDVILAWKDNPVQVSSQIYIPGYTFVSHNEDTCNSKTTTGEYSCLVTYINLDRISYPYIIRVFMPMTLLVLLSWSSFWLHTSAVAERLGVGIITTLTTALLLFRDEDFMRLPSLTLMDIWTALSAFYVIAALFEFILITHLMKKGSSGTVHADSDHENDPETAQKAKPKQRTIFFIDIPEGVHTVDAVSKIIFPATYSMAYLLFGPITYVRV